MALVSTITGATLYFIENTVPLLDGTISAKVSAASYNPASRDMTLTLVGQQSATIVFHDIPKQDWQQIQAIGGF